MFSTLIKEPKIIIGICLLLLIVGMGFRIYQLSSSIKVLTAQMETLETEKVTLQERLTIANTNNEILTVDVTVLKEHITEMDRECEARVARAASKITFIEKRTYIPQKTAIDKGVLDENSNKMLLEYLGTHIFK